MDKLQFMEISCIMIMMDIQHCGIMKLCAFMLLIHIYQFIFQNLSPSLFIHQKMSFKYGIFLVLIRTVFRTLIKYKITLTTLLHYYYMWVLRTVISTQK